MAQRIDALPGVRPPRWRSRCPPRAASICRSGSKAGRCTGDSQYHGDENWRSVTPEYFRALAIPVTRGRVFDDRDTARRDTGRRRQRGVREEVLARAPTRSARQITIGKGLGPEFEDRLARSSAIVAMSAKTASIRAAPPVIYVPVAQMSDALTRLVNSLIPASWIVQGRRRQRRPAAARFRRNSWPSTGSCRSPSVQSMEQVIARSIARQNFNMLLLGIFGAIALLLAAIGIYGLMSYSVEQNAHDIGVRLALGAARRDILSMVVSSGHEARRWSGSRSACCGAFWAARLLTRHAVRREADRSCDLRSRSSRRWATVAFLACYLPARRAMRVDPIIALRQE